jgi:TIR domain-containing protein
MDGDESMTTLQAPRAKRWSMWQLREKRSEPILAYKAFISYKHVTSSGFARGLETALMAYAKPLLARPIGIFRDEKHLAPGIDLPALINEALDASEFLLLLASPEAARSSWVSDELDRWCRVLDRSTNLIVVLVAGEIAIDEVTKRIDWARSDALPPILQGYLDHVPFFVDFRVIAFVDDVTLADPDIKRAVNGIMARFRDIDPNEMLGEEIRQHRRNLLLRNVAVVALVALALASGIVAWVALGQREQAKTARLLAEQNGKRAVASAITANRNAKAAVASAVDAERKLALNLGNSGDLARALWLYIDTVRRSGKMDDDAAEAIRFLAQRRTNFRQAVSIPGPNIFSWRGRVFLINKSGNFIPMSINAETYTINQALGVMLVIDISRRISIIDDKIGTVLWQPLQGKWPKEVSFIYTHGELLSTYVFLSAVQESQGFRLYGKHNANTDNYRSDVVADLNVVRRRVDFQPYKRHEELATEDQGKRFDFTQVPEINFPALIPEARLWHAASRPEPKLEPATIAPSGMPITDLIRSLTWEPTLAQQQDDLYAEGAVESCKGSAADYLFEFHNSDLEESYRIGGHLFLVLGNGAGAHTYCHHIVRTNMKGVIDRVFHIEDLGGIKLFRRQNYILYSADVLRSPHPLTVLDARTVEELCCVDGFDAGPDEGGISVSPNQQFIAVRMDIHTGGWTEGNVEDPRPGFQVGLFKREREKITKARVLTTPSREPVDSVVFISDDLLGVVSGRNRVSAFDVGTGALVWSKRYQREEGSAGILAITSCATCRVAVVYGGSYFQLVLKSSGLPLSELVDSRYDLRLRGKIATVRVWPGGELMLCTNRGQCWERDAPAGVEKLGDLLSRPGYWTGVNSVGEDLSDLPK